MNERANITHIITDQQSHDTVGALSFNNRQVLKNKDRFLEETDSIHEWNTHTLQKGAEEQRRDLYRKKIDYNKFLGTFIRECDKDSHSDYFTGNRTE